MLSTISEEEVIATTSKQDSYKYKRMLAALRILQERELPSGQEETVVDHRWLQPTQLSTILCMPPVLLHAYVKQNDIFFFFWLCTFVTSVIWHFKKFEYSYAIRSKQFYHTLDIVSVVTLNLATSYEVCRHFEFTPYYMTGWAVYLFTLAVFLIGVGTGRWMGDPREHVAERWHALWHVLPTVASHMFLAIYKRPMLQAAV